MKKGIKVDSNDNIATVLDDIKSGEKLPIYNLNNEITQEIEALEHIPYGNKIALEDIETGKDVIKYGEKIGQTEIKISKGQLVHVHNIKSYSIDIPDSVKLEVMRKMNI